jgi:hypothetical protein
MYKWAKAKNVQIKQCFRPLQEYCTKSPYTVFCCPALNFKGLNIRNASDDESSDSCRYVGLLVN